MNRKKQTQVDTIKYADKRSNIPTEETKSFMTDDQKKQPVVLYPRNPDLDPQLVWRGKDAQDAADLEVPSVPIYIQEKIHPQALIEDLRAFAAGQRSEQQAQLFSDFNGLDFEKHLEFYQHVNRWSNRMILGDSLLTMTSLAEREGLKGKVQMIYLDPPYGIKFGSNWQVSTRKRDVKDTGLGNVTRQPEQIKAFRDTWELGLHSYLAYLRDRLVVARELLTESGSLFVQIGDENVHLVRCLMDEVMGRENFVALITYKVSSGTQQKVGPKRISDFLLWYAKDIEQAKYRRLYQDKELGEDSTFTSLQLTDDSIRSMSKEERDGSSQFPSGSRPLRTLPLHSQGLGDNSPRSFAGKAWNIAGASHWRYSVEGFVRLVKANRIREGKSVLEAIYYFNDFLVSEITTTWIDTSPETDKDYVVQTSLGPIQRCLLMTTDPGDLVLDPTCGSGTTAYVAEQWGRRWITIDTSRVALALARTRLMAAKFPYYYLADSEEGWKRELEVAGTPPLTPPLQAGGERRFTIDVRQGFVYKKVPHVTLKSIANNDEIDVIHAKWQEKLEPLRAEINKSAGKNWEEWEVPRPSQSAPSTLSTRLEEYWGLRRSRQAEIDASIARHADTETLYDQPYEDRKRVRVTGPFTVESLSPHRFLGFEGKRAFDESLGVHTETRGPGEFETIILDNLRISGAQNTFKGERLKFDTLDAFPGQFIHGAGETTEKDGTVKRVAVCVGPEYGTVAPDLIREAAKEAMKKEGGFDILLVLGFNLDGMAPEEAKQFGRLKVLIAKMAPELNYGDELLKKTGAGNLFMIIGEPDIELRRTKDGKMVVEVKGMDVYDPTTGVVRSSSPDEIACWFIDTDYNAESFFVRHAYFTGADKPYERLQKTLKAEIDESAWTAIYSAVSRPFDPPKKGKIAVKVINHFGDEVLKVYEVGS